MELVWQKCQIMMQAQSSKARKRPVSGNFQSHTSTVEHVRTAGACVEMGLTQDDDVVPWFDDYSSQLLPEVFGVSINVIDKDSHSLHDGVSLDPSNTCKVSSCSTTVRSGVSDIGSSKARYSIWSQDSILPYSSSSLLNFSHFSRPAAMARAHLQNNEHHAVNGKEMEFLSQPSLNSGKLVSNSLMSKPLEDATDVVLDANAPNGPDTKKSVESVGASSFVCFGNGAERASNDLTKKLKRKSCESEDFESQSEDIEQESLGTKTEASS